MLEDYYVKPSTIDRVRSSWLAPQIESYLEWLQAHVYSRLVVYRRLPLLFHFAEFAQKKGCRDIASCTMKRTALPQTDYLEHDEIETLFNTLPRHGSLSLRDRGIFMVLYNTGARVQEIADLRIADVDLDGPLRIRLRGKGDKWRSCPLWPETAEVEEVNR